MTTGASGVLGFLRRRALPHVEERLPHGLRRALPVEGREIVVELAVEDGDVRPGANLPPIARRAIQDVLDVDCDPRAVADVLRRDRWLRALVDANPDVRIPGAFDGHETAVRAVLGQQVTVTGANTLAGRLVERWGHRLDPPRGAVTHTFPSATTLAGTDVAAIGMPRSRARTIRSLSSQIADGRLVLTASTDKEETGAKLRAVRGVGSWTASYIAMRVLRDRDAFMADDLGVRKGAAVLGLPSEPRALQTHAERWRPYRAHAVMYLWMAAQTPP